MTAGNNVIKITALTALKNNMAKTIFSCVIFMFSIFLVSFVISLIEIFSGEIISNILRVVYFIFAVFPMFLGTLRFVWRLLFSADDNPICVFYYFSEKQLYLKALKLLFSVVLRMLPLIIALSLPVIFVRVISLGNIFELIDMPIPIWSPNLSYVYVFLSTLAFIVVFLFSLRYYMAPILFVADDNMDVAEAIHMSTVISKKTSLEFLYLIFGFLGWIFLSVLIIPLVFTLPYFLTSYAVHVRFAIAEYNMHLKKASEDDFPTFVAGV